MRHLPEYCSDPCELREEVIAIEQEAVAAALARVRERCVASRPSERAGWNAMAGEAYAYDRIIRFIDEEAGW
jgi:hypothetical protein